MRPKLRSAVVGVRLNPTISIFSAPRPFAGSIGVRQSLAIRSWLALSPQITVILFSQDSSVVSSARSLSSRVYVDSNIDFTYVKFLASSVFVANVISSCVVRKFSNAEKFR